MKLTNFLNSLDRFVWLKDLDASHNKISGIYGNPSADTLENLDISYNSFEGEIPSILGELKVLRTLKLDGNGKILLNKEKK